MRIVVVSAHPDDETIGCGALLGRAVDAHIVHLTDGAPEDPRLFAPQWHGDRDGYRRARRREVERALALAGIAKTAIACFGAADQEASFAMTELARRLAAFFLRLCPDVVIAHPYEGGHPDHDAAAFITSAALQLVRVERGLVPCAVEMTSYHGAPGRLVTGAFLGQGDDEEAAHEHTGELREHPRTAARRARGGELCREDRARKARMLACFETQRETLAAFSLATERFRPQPDYDFSRAPHRGPLYYEQLGWSMTGQKWRALAVAAHDELFGARR
jgi:LmbE family N-acetylglucosaminyl deacetylase